MTVPTSFLVFGLVAFLYLVGWVGHLIPELLPYLLWLTPWFLLGSGAVIAGFWAWKSDLRTLVLCLVPLFLVTFLLEAVGVATGLVFGSYHYGEVLGFKIAEVPPVIGWNWVLVVLGFHGLAKQFLPSWTPWGRNLAVGLACVGFDLLLEPVAISLGYWVWPGNVVPLQNYVAWGVIAAAGSWWSDRFSSLPSSPLLGWYALLQMVFFVGLTLAGVQA